MAALRSRLTGGVAAPSGASPKVRSLAQRIKAGEGVGAFLAPGAGSGDRQAAAGFLQQRDAVQAGGDRFGVQGAKAVGPLEVNQRKSVAGNDRAGAAFQTFTKPDGSQYHVYAMNGKRLVFRVRAPSGASSGGVAAA